MTANRLPASWMNALDPAAGARRSRLTAARAGAPRCPYISRRSRPASGPTLTVPSSCRRGELPRRLRASCARKVIPGAHASDRARSYCELHCSACCCSTASEDAANRHRYATRRQLRCVSARSPGSSWINGQNVAVELRTGRFGQRDQIPDLVSEILALKVDVIVAGSPLVITALKQATMTAGGGMRAAFSAE